MSAQTGLERAGSMFTLVLIGGLSLLAVLAGVGIAPSTVSYGFGVIALFCVLGMLVLRTSTRLVWVYLFPLSAVLGFVGCLVLA